MRPSARGREGDWLIRQNLTVSERRAWGTPQKLMETFVGGLAEENTLREAHEHLSTKKEKQEGEGGGVRMGNTCIPMVEGGGVEGKLTHSVACHISSDLAFGVFSQYRVSISSRLFNIYSIQGIIHSMISWHGLCSIWSNLYAFILRAAL